MTSPAFSDMVPHGRIELWQNGDGKWAWSIIDQPDVNEPGTVLFDTCRHPTAEIALADVDKLLRDHGYGVGLRRE